MVARGAKRSIKVATASHFLFADCRFIAGVLVVGVKQGRGGFCSGWSWCNLASDIKFLFTTLDVYHLRFRLFPEPLQIGSCFVPWWRGGPKGALRWRLRAIFYLLIVGS